MEVNDYPANSEHAVVSRRKGATTRSFASKMGATLLHSQEWLYWGSCNETFREDAQGFSFECGNDCGAALTSGKLGLVRDLLSGAKSGIELCRLIRRRITLCELQPRRWRLGKSKIVSAVTYNGQFLGRC